MWLIRQKDHLITSVENIQALHIENWLTNNKGNGQLLSRAKIFSNTVSGLHTLKNAGLNMDKRSDWQFCCNVQMLIGENKHENIRIKHTEECVSVSKPHFIHYIFSSSNIQNKGNMICLLHCDPPAVYQSVSQIWWAAKKSRNQSINRGTQKLTHRSWGKCNKFKFPSTLNENV